MNDASQHDAGSKDAALAWFVRLNSGDATNVEREAHARWLLESPLNRAEYRKLESLWSTLDHVDRPVVNARPVMARRRFLIGVGTGVAASVAGVMAWRAGYIPAFGTLATGTAEQRQIALEDGSSVMMDAATSLRLDYQKDRRAIDLLSGRAFFTVTPDQQRPFTVRAMDGQVTAVGTRFSVYRRHTAVTVISEEGELLVTAPDGEHSAMQAPESLTYDMNGIGVPSASDVETAFAWKRGKLIFEDQPLAAVIEDVNRYRHGTIRLLGNDLASLQVSGVFDLRHPDQVLETITQTLPVRATRLTDYLVILHSA